MLALFLGSQAYAEDCQHYWDKYKHYSKLSEDVANGTILAAAAVAFVCPLCVAHMVVASGMVMAVSIKLDEYADIHKKNYQTCIEDEKAEYAYSRQQEAERLAERLKQEELFKNAADIAKLNELALKIGAKLKSLGIEEDDMQAYCDDINYMLDVKLKDTFTTVTLLWMAQRRNMKEEGTWCTH